MDDITIEDCELVLSKALKSEEATIIESRLSLASKDQDGFFGDTFILKIIYEIQNEKKHRLFFVKILPESSEHAEMAIELRAYDKETFFYNTLLREYKLLGFDTSFVPEYYLSKDNMLIMDELMHKGYKNRVVFDYETCKSSLKALAYFHGGSLLYEEFKSKDGRFRLDEEYPYIFEERFYKFEDKNSFIYKHFTVAFKCLTELMRHLPDDERKKEEFLRIVEEKYRRVSEIFNKELGSRKVCSHGDLWRRNIMFQEGTNDCRLVDFQMLRYYYPAFDLLTLLTFCTTKDLRDEHMDDLIKYYYEQLSYATNEEVRLLLPFDEFTESVKYFGFLSAYQAFAGHLLDVESDATASDILFGERDKYACHNFLNNFHYKKLMSDDIYSLMNTVLSD